MHTKEHIHKTPDLHTLDIGGVWRHALIVVVFSVLSVGPSLFLLGGRIEELGGGFYLFTAANAVVLVVFCYLNLYLLAPRLLLKGRYAEYLAVLLGGILAYIASKWMAEGWLLARVGVERHFNAVTALDWLSNMTIYAVCLASGSAVLLFRQWVADTQKIHDLENARLQSRVDEFKERIDAPVLYRVLGYAAKKVKTDPKKVSEIIFHLSDRLRRQLYDDGNRER